MLEDSCDNDLPTLTRCLLVDAEPTVEARHILLAGAPRSGTTWTQKIMTAAYRLHPVFEPDNEHQYPISFALRRKSPRYPTQADAASTIDLFRLALYKPILFSPAFRPIWRPIGRRLYQEREQPRARPTSLSQIDRLAPMTRMICIKSVHSCLALDRVKQDLPECEIVLIERSPRSILRSFLGTRLDDSQSPSVLRHFRGDTEQIRRQAGSHFVGNAIAATAVFATATDDAQQKFGSIDFNQLRQDPLQTLSSAMPNRPMREDAAERVERLILDHQGDTLNAFKTVRPAGGRSVQPELTSQHEELLHQAIQTQSRHAN